MPSYPRETNCSCIYSGLNVGLKLRTVWPGHGWHTDMYGGWGLPREITYNRAPDSGFVLGPHQLMTVLQAVQVSVFELFGRCARSRIIQN